MKTYFAHQSNQFRNLWYWNGPYLSLSEVLRVSPEDQVLKPNLIPSNPKPAFSSGPNTLCASGQCICADFAANICDGWQMMNFSKTYLSKRSKQDLSPSDSDPSRRAGY